jgi:hypothetical protein
LSHESFFGAPSAARMLFGLIETANRYALESAASVEISIKEANLNLFFNCDQDYIDGSLASPIPSDAIEVAMSNAVMNTIIPFPMTLEWK